MLFLQFWQVVLVNCLYATLHCCNRDGVTIMPAFPLDLFCGNISQEDVGNA